MAELCTPPGSAVSPAVHPYDVAMAPEAAVRAGIVVSRTPLRVSFSGGGTDFPDFFCRQEGAVLSTAIDKYVYVTLKRHDTLFGAPIRLNYSETEQVESIEEIRNDIARACFQYLSVKPPLYVSTVADIPASSGLGSSSAFCVGLLHALHAWRGEHASAAQLAEEAVEVEVKLLRRPIGFQDHYASAFGGFNFYRFCPDSSVSVEAQRFAPGMRQRLFDHALMFWTGIERQASAVLEEQKANVLNRLPQLLDLRAQAWSMRELLAQDCDLEVIGRTLHAGWAKKRSLASTVSTAQLDAWYERAVAAGAWGGKICGAGGGGFFLFIVPPHRQPSVREALVDLKELTIGYEPHGSKILLPNRE